MNTHILVLALASLTLSQFASATSSYRNVVHCSLSESTRKHSLDLDIIEYMGPPGTPVSFTAEIRETKEGVQLDPSDYAVEKEPAQPGVMGAPTVYEGVKGEMPFALEMVTDAFRVDGGIPSRLDARTKAGRHIRAKLSCSLAR